MPYRVVRQGVILWEKSSLPQRELSRFLLRNDFRSSTQNLVEGDEIAHAQKPDGNQLLLRAIVMQSFGQDFVDTQKRVSTLSALGATVQANDFLEHPQNGIVQAFHQAGSIQRSRNRHRSVNDLYPAGAAGS